MVDFPPEFPAEIFDVRKLERPVKKIESTRKNSKLIQTLEEIASNFNDDYHNRLLSSAESMLKSIIPDSYLFDKYNSALSSIGKQTAHISNHYSHFDYMLQLFNLQKLGFPKPLILARENVFKNPFNYMFNLLAHDTKFTFYNIPKLAADLFNLTRETNSFRKCRALEVPMNLSGFSNRRKLTIGIKAAINGRYDLFNYPNGGRHRNNKEIGEFQEAGFKVTFNEAKKLGPEIQILPHYIGYDIPPETPYFPIIDAIHDNFLPLYPATDAALSGLAFISRKINPRGAVIHALGKPMPISDFKNAKSALQATYDQIIELRKIYQPKIDNWQGKEYSSEKEIDFDNLVQRV
jgi:1-acyl-sn-glycerol-3-phosphate acyltransferase